MNKMARDILTTDRLLVRTMIQGDLNSLSAIFADSEVMQYMGRGNIATREQTQEMIIRRGVCGQKWPLNVWALLRNDNQRLVGTCGILETDVKGVSEVEIGYQLARHAWGRGYATEVANALVNYGFETLKLRRLIAMTHPENVRSQRVIQKIGLRFERQVDLPKGVRLIYAIQKECI